MFIFDFSWASGALDPESTSSGDLVSSVKRYTIFIATSLLFFPCLWSFLTLNTTLPCCFFEYESHFWCICLFFLIGVYGQWLQCFLLIACFKHLQRKFLYLGYYAKPSWFCSLPYVMMTGTTNIVNISKISWYAKNWEMRYLILPQCFKISWISENLALFFWGFA